MTYTIYGAIVLISSFLWRVRGGLRFWGHKAPINKIWFAIWFGALSVYFVGWYPEVFVNVTLATFISYQLYGWGLYIGRLLTGIAVDPEKDGQCELIDEQIMPLHITLKGTKYYLWQYPRLFGFIGTCLTGLIVTYLIGLAMGSFWFQISGLGMGFCYWLGGKLEKIKPLGKAGWNWGEWIFGAYMGLMLVLCMTH